MSQKQHSNLGPSSAERWWNCPGSVALSATVPPGVDSIHSAQGTVAHDLCEQHVTGQLTVKQLMAAIGTVVKHRGFSIEIDEEMIEAVISYRDVIEADRKEMGPNAIGKAEVKVKATSIDPMLYGTADYILYETASQRLKVYDFKYGKGVMVAVTENKQMAIYAVAALDTLLVSGSGAGFREIELIVIQPRAGDQAVRRWKVPKKWLAEFRTELKAAVEATRVEAARMEAGKHCRWCPAKAICPVAFEEVQKQAMVDFAVPAPAPEILPDVASLPMDKLTAAMEYEDFINGWFEAARLRLRAALEAGEEVPGFKLVDGESNRKFTDEKAVVAEFAPLLGEDALFEKKLLSPAKLEKIVGKGKLDHLTFKPEVPKAIARDTDPRPSARRTVEQDFGAVAPASLEAPAAEKKTKKLWP